MHPNPVTDVYSPDEIARAAGVPEDAVVAAVGGATALVPLGDAIRIARTLRRTHAVASSIVSTSVAE